MIRHIVFTMMFSLLAAMSLDAAPSTTPGNAEIRKMLVDRVDVQHQSSGIVVGVIDADGRRVVAYGNADNGSTTKIDGDTVFEIGSATKVFTSLLLAIAVERGEVALNDSVAKYLPAGVKVPERGGKKITLLDLATHTSGLPRLPSNFAPKDPSNPYADYTVRQLYDFLGTYELPRDIGSQYEYSNLGGGLLGHVLSLRAGTDYETLFQARIAKPLELKSTAIALSSDMKRRLAIGHNDRGERVPNWDFPTLAGAGALRSTANDLLTFLAAELGYEKTPLAAAMASQLAVRRPTSNAGLEIALGWHIFKKGGDREIVWHNGGTGGYRSFIGYDPTTRVGVVVLSNTSTAAGVDDIGQHLLDPAVALSQAPKNHKEIAIDTKILDGYVGRYQLAPNFILTVTRDQKRLFAQATGQSTIELFAEGNREFFMKAVDAQIAFETDDQGKATSLTLHQNGAHMPAKRIEGNADTKKEVAVAPEVLERYVGRYAINPAFVLTVTRENDHLFLQATGQPRFPLFADGERHFLLKVVDAQITFEVDAEGHTTKLVLYQNGMDQAATRMP
jgi:D-alanyl-D-alanine-carboxypeptidase/D-alanyl-D-alanine-endopeptidase